MRNCFLLFLLFLLFFSCSKEKSVVDEKSKKDFFVDVRKIGDFQNLAYLEKTGKVDSSQNININSLASGRVSKIFVKVGQEVYSGQNLAILDDNIANYYLSLQSARNNVEKSQNALSIAKNALDKAKLNYDSNAISLNKTIKDIERDLDDLNSSDIDTSSSIELEKINNSIDKLNLEYKNLIKTQEQSLENFGKNLEKELFSLKNFLDSVISFGDSIYGVSSFNKKENDKIEDYIGVKDKNQKDQTIDSLNDLIIYRNEEIKDLQSNFLKDFDSSQLFKKMDYAYKKINDFLSKSDTTLVNSVSSVGSLNDTQISSFKTQNTNLRNSFTSLYAGFLAVDNSIKNFLDTYKNSRESLEKQIENFGKDKNIFLKKISLNTQLIEGNLTQAKSNRDISLRSLELAINDAKNSLKDSYIRLEDSKIALSQAEKQYEKLTIKSPINGVISDIFIDEGQEISIGSPTFLIIGDNSKEIQVFFSENEINSINSGDLVFYENNGKSFTGEIISISKNLDQNLKYIGYVKFKDLPKSIGNIVDLKIPLILENKLIPLNIVKIKDSGLASINYLSGSIDTTFSIMQKDISLGEIYGDFIELKSKLSDDLMLITNYIDNFDKEKFQIKIKKILTPN